MDSSINSDEMFLAEELKLLCDEKGKELHENLEKSANIFNQMGLVYKRKIPDKIKIIQGIALLNAAIVRQPTNEKYKSDLKDFCWEVLRTAKAKNSATDLVAISSEVSEKIQKMRESSLMEIENLQPIPYEFSKQALRKMEERKVNEIMKIQNCITDQYTKIMAFISEKCIEALGEPPCLYALVGMGSLAKKEVTLFSDFEHIVVLEDGIQDWENYEDILKYFRWYSTIFIIILVNLKETILRFLTIPFLNDINNSGGDWFFDAFTPCGISPDGFQPAACKMPLGRTQETKDKPWTTELIKPLNEMIKYLDTHEALKNGYHLFDILTKTCFVSGDKKIHKEFLRRKNEALLKNQFNPELLDLLADDLRCFDTMTTLRDLVVSDKLDIKRVVYRCTTLYISALGRLQAIEACSCFDIIASLQKQNIINEENAHKLSYAVAVACEIRQKVYSAAKGQDDFLAQEHFDHTTARTLTASGLIKLVGEKSLVDYFTVAFDLQTTFKNKNVLGNLDKYLSSCPSSKFNIWHNLSLHKTLILEWEKSEENYPSMPPSHEMSLVRHSVACAYLANRKLDSAIATWEWIAQHEKEDGQLCGWAMVSIAKCLYEMQLYQDAIRHLNEIRPKLDDLNLKAVDKNYQLSIWANTYALCKISTGDYQQAAILFGEEYNLCKDPDLPLRDTRQAECFLNVAVCHLQLRSPFTALERAVMALELFKKAKASTPLIANCHHAIGQCFAMQGQHEKAIHNLNISLNLRQGIIRPDMQDKDENLKTIQAFIKASENALARKSQV